MTSTDSSGDDSVKIAGLFSSDSKLNRNIPKNTAQRKNNDHELQSENLEIINYKDESKNRKRKAHTKLNDRQDQEIENDGKRIKLGSLICDDMNVREKMFQVSYEWMSLLFIALNSEVINFINFPPVECLLNFINFIKNFIIYY